ncbi:nucleolar protein 12-like [Plakobranchus ocellatus]|uniref:Nucleolar protein 12-like n=1 Tax=Plakobranchus ocellatus TaxID=259542 RepID=A0AAV4ABU1_9GAST|nr:nucleolar protein 12-like [Plakobranchus ocellatus]
MAASSVPSKKHRPKNRKTKTVLEFSEKLRQEYLRGFQKRKNERRKLAREKHDKKILEERKSLLKQARDSKSKSKMGLMPDPEIEQLVQPEVFDLPEHTVTISNIGEVDFVGKSGLRLGQNTGSINKDIIESGELEEREQQQPPGKKSLRQQ